MARLEQAQEQIVTQQKLASLGALTAGVAHEIKNPLNFINNFADLSRELAVELEAEIASKRDALPGDFVDDAEDIIESLKTNVSKIYEHGRRADSIVYSMLQHSRGGQGERQETELNAFLEEYFNLAYHGMRARNSDFNATLKRDYDPSVGKIVMVPQDMGRVFLNLIGNAFDALDEHGARDGQPTVSVATSRRDGAVEIRISDNGPGVPDHVRSRIFEPFFTTKPTGKGTGLGLSMSYDIVTKGHGGTLDVVSETGNGATFVVRLPA
jgi:signal transduction histidine kinase